MYPGSHAWFRQESAIKRGSQWFVFRQTGTGREGEVFSCCGDQLCFCFVFFQTHRGESVSQFILFFWLILDYIMNHLLSGSSVAHLFEYATCAICLSYRSMGPTLLHSSHASNSSPTGLTHRSPPHFLSFSPFHLCFLSLNCPNTYTGYNWPAPFPVFVPYFYHKRRWGEGKKRAECSLCSRLTRPPICIHFLSPFRGGMAKRTLAASSGISPGAQSEHLTSSLVFVFPTLALIVF